jgi:hypothetical protein
MWTPQAAIAAAILALSGCAAIQGHNAADSEQLLDQAGFRRDAASSAAQGAGSGATLPVRQLTALAVNGNTAYEFYDPQFCQCVYVGGAQELAKLQQLRSARVAEHAQNLRSWNPAGNSPDPGVWGPWNPAGLDVK